MIKSVNNYPVSQLFDIEAGVVYAIPRYQREYTWGKNQWESLFDDVLENDPGYFLGSIICINQSQDTLEIQRLELVDGQQRLTTLSLLFASVYQTLKQHEPELDEDQRVELVNLKRKLVLKKGEEQLRVIPQIQNNNQSDYRAVLAETGMIGECEALPYAGNRKVFRAYRYFQNRIAEMTSDSEHRITRIMEYLDKVNRACLVKIEVASHADAYILFESLNDRGMPLTAIDLIKNKLLARLETLEPGKIDHYFNQWNRLLEYLGDDYAIQERFFRHYYNAFREDLKAVYQVPLATRSNLIQIYEKLINLDAKECLQKLTAAGRLYALFLARQSEPTLASLESPLRDLERIQGAPAYLLLLNLLVRRKELELDPKHLSQVTSLLVRFFVRRNLTDVPATRDLNRFFMGMLDNLAGLTGKSVPQYFQEQLIAISVSDEVFQQKLKGPIYEESTGVTRFILCALAEQSMTKETWVDLWKMEGKQYLWTIEHIFPQGENIPEPWIAMMAGGDAQAAKDIQRMHVHRLGNLTLSGFNSALGNKSFIEKRDRLEHLGRPGGYKNGLNLNEDLAGAEVWNVECIEARTAKLAEMVMAKFRLGELLE